MAEWRTLLPEGFADSVEGKAMISMFSQSAPMDKSDLDHEKNVVEMFLFDESEVKVTEESKIKPISNVSFQTSSGEVLRPPRISIGFNFLSTNHRLSVDGKGVETSIMSISTGTDLDSLNGFISAGGTLALWLLAQNWQLFRETVFRREWHSGNEILLNAMIGNVNEHVPKTWEASLREAEHASLDQACEETARLAVRRKI